MAVDNWQCNSLLASALSYRTKQRNYLFFQTKVVGDSRSIATENYVPVKRLPDNYQKNCLLPSAVKFVDRNIEAAIVSNEGC